jgi:hypothetical protein
MPFPPPGFGGQVGPHVGPDLGELVHGPFGMSLVAFGLADGDQAGRCTP